MAMRGTLGSALIGLRDGLRDRPLEPPALGIGRKSRPGRRLWRTESSWKIRGKRVVLADDTSYDRCRRERNPDPPDPEEPR